jgi:hypothetical protein
LRDGVILNALYSFPADYFMIRFGWPKVKIKKPFASQRTFFHLQAWESGLNDCDLSFPADYFMIRFGWPKVEIKKPFA